MVNGGLLAFQTRSRILCPNANKQGKTSSKGEKREQRTVRECQKIEVGAGSRFVESNTGLYGGSAEFRVMSC
jgi:hypothetical protein